VIVGNDIARGVARLMPEPHPKNVRLKNISQLAPVASKMQIAKHAFDGGKNKK
jgi:hypothetical protein